MFIFCRSLVFYPAYTVLSLNADISNQKLMEELEDIKFCDSNHYTN